MAICENCGSRYSGRSAHADFRDYLRLNGFDKFMDEAESSYNDHYCLECNKDNAYEAVGSYEVCDDCGVMFRPEDEEEEFEDYLGDLGYRGDMRESAMSYFDYNLCAKCNIKSFDPDDFVEEYEREQDEARMEYERARKEEGYESEDDEDPGVYRSYEDYLASGGPVDPCDDALWLHDQE